MSLNEEYLDELLKAVTTEENVPKQPVLNKSSEENEIAKVTSDIEQDNTKEQEKRHTFSEDDLTEMLEHLEEIDASSLSDIEISKESVFQESGDGELEIEDPVVEERVDVAQIGDNPLNDKSLNEAEQSTEDLLQGANENNLFEVEDTILETKDNKTEIDEAASMAESAEYLSDIEELLKNIEDSEVKPQMDIVQESNIDHFNESTNEVAEDETLLNDFNEDIFKETEDTEIEDIEEKDTEIEDMGTEVNEAEEGTREVREKEELDENIFGDGITSDNEDIMSLLGAMDDNEELAEISDLLSKDENHEEIENDDMMAILEQAAALEEHAEKADYDLTNEDGDSEGDKKKKRFGKKKVKKEKKAVEDNAEEKKSKDEESKDVGSKEKKKGFFEKILNIFFEEEEEDIEEEIPGVGEEGATDENLAILEQLNNEKSEKKKKEKNKKEKKPKEPKKVKEKKPKKEKQPKEPKPVEKSEKKIPKKKIIKVVFFAISILVALLLVVILIPNKIAFQNATKAYEEQDYKAAYKELVGMNLNDNEKVILKKVSTILELQEKYEAYVNYDKMDMKLEALNSLLQGIVRYDKSISYADKINVSTELDTTYQQIVSALNQNYGISEEDARKIIAYDKVTYTKKLDSIINGTEFVDPNAPVEEQETLEDMLPEEELMMQEVKKSETESEATTEVTTEAITETNTEATTEENNTSDIGGKAVTDENIDTNEKELYRGNVSGSDASVDFSK